MSKVQLYICLLILFLSCKESVIENKKVSMNQSSYKLNKGLVKQFLLDSITAQKPKYIQILEVPNDGLILTFLNSFNNSIYYYDYNSTNFIKSKSFNESNNIVRSLGGYYIDKNDFIYLYDESNSSIIFIDSTDNILKKRKLLTSDYSSQYIKYPIYLFSTLNPIIKTNNHLLITGFYPWKIPDSLINKFSMTNKFNISKFKSDGFENQYPEEIYGSDFFWDDPLFTYPYTTYNDKKNQIIYSFPVSHDIYFTDENDGIMNKLYAGSQNADDIVGIDKDIIKSKEKVKDYFLHTNTYGGIIYDKFRNLYYRIVIHKVNDSNTNQDLGDKPLGVTIFNADFKYLGETIIGISENFNWKNTFVTEEGIYIERINKNDLSEMYLEFQLYNLEIND